MTKLLQFSYELSLWSTIVLAINVILILLNIRKGRVAHWFTAYQVFSLVIVIASRILALQSTNNLKLLHLYTLGEFVLLILFFKSQLKEVVIVQKYTQWVLVIGIVLIIGNTIFLQSLDGFNSNAKTFAHLIILSYLIIYFYTHLKIENVQYLESGPLIINSALLFYFSGSLFIFMTSNILELLSESAKDMVWIINAGLYLLFQLAVFIGVWKTVYQRPKSLF